MFKLGIGLLLLVSAKGETETTVPPEPNLPSVFAIFKETAPICAGVPVLALGTIVYIITAAHCVNGVSNLMVKESKKNSIAVSRVYIHPYYTPPSMDYDIAVIIIKKPENYEIRPVNLDTKQPLPTDPLSVINLNLKQIESQPEKISAKLEERKSCKAKLSGQISVTTKMICAYVETEVDGSPLIGENNSVVGIGSYYTKKGNGGLPKIFTNIANSEIYSFINKYVPF